MDLEFYVIAGPDRDKRFSAPDSGSLLFGTSSAVQYRLSDPDVAMAHFEVRVEGSTLWLVDAGSAHGTKVNGRRAGEVELQIGDLITAGKTQLKLQKAGDDGESSPDQAAPAPPAAIPAAAAPAAPAAKPPAPTLSIKKLSGQDFGHYAMGKIIAEGRSSIVYMGHDSKRDATVAVKVLRPEHADTEERINRFIRAMKAVLKLEHPNLITVYGAGKSHGLCWAAMEYVDGESLSNVIKRIGIAGQLEWTFAFKVAVQIARALVVAYENQIIHRNITPTNIMMSKQGVAKLGDLMLAKGLEGEAAIEVTQMDGPGQMIGEDVLYMPPERLRGEEMDSRSDIYGLGATVYALLTGRPPLEGSNPLKAILAGAKVEPPKKYQLAIPDLVEGIILTMVQQKPEDRFKDPVALLKELERAAKFCGIKVD